MESKIHEWKSIAIAASVLSAYGLPAVAEANGEHIHFGAINMDPIVGGVVVVFVVLITLMFVGQWIRFNAARRRAAGTALSQKPLKRREEATNDQG